MVYQVGFRRPFLLRNIRSGANYARIAGKVAAAAYRNRGRIQRAAKFAAKRMSRKKATPTYRRKSSTRRNANKNKEQDKRISKLSKQVDQATGHLTYRTIAGTQSLAAANKQQVEYFGPNTTTILETVLGQCKYFDPSNPGTLLTASQASGTYSRISQFDSVSAKLTIRNNYQSTASVKVYLFVNKDDTSKGSTSAWSDSITNGDVAGSVDSIDDIGAYPTDLALLTDLYKVTKIKDVVLQPGQVARVSHTSKGFSYDSATVDSHALGYQRQYQSFQMCVVHHGLPAHDSVVADQCGLPATGMDIRSDYVYKVTYNAGINLRYAYVDSAGLSNATNGFVESQKPVSDNQAFSIA